MNHAPRVHWLRGNKGERTPRRLLFLDTESEQETEAERELHRLRCWVMRAVVRAETPGGITECEQVEGTSREGLLAAVERATKGSHAWRLFTHNLSYDLGLTRLPLDLLAAGWHLGKHNLASDQPWAHFAKGSRGLWLCDSWSWLPQKLETLGDRLGIRKPPLPRPDDGPEEWFGRCRADVDILASAMLELMEEWDRRNLGWWSITGPASGWNTMLHFPARGRSKQEVSRVHKSENRTAPPAKERVLVVPDPTSRGFERQALYSGRRDVWKVGQLAPGPYAEIDLKNAHLTICASLPLPYRRWEPFDSLDLADWRLRNPGAGLIAEAVVRTTTPRYPVRSGAVVLHPRGRFKTVLAGPEILEAKRRGELESIGHGYGYHLGHTMRDWATWALAILNTPDGEVSPMLWYAVKSWGRTVPGRWGMLHAKAIKAGPSHVKDWALEPVTVGSPPRRGSIFHLAGTWTESIMDEEADDSFPAVLAYVQSYCRLALNAMLDALPERDLVSCNTEGAWVAERGLDGSRLWYGPAMMAGNPDATPISLGLRHLNQKVAPLVAQVKRTARHLKLLSPQHHLADGTRLYSGIPRAAEDLGGERYQFHTWPKLRGQIERGDPRGYVREQRTVNLSAMPVSRWAYSDGHCEPVAMAWSPESGNVIQPPDPELAGRHGPLRASQHPILRRVLKQS